MTEKLVIQAQDRKALGKRFARFYRTQDQILAVMYDAKSGSRSLVLPGKIVRYILSFADCFNRVWNMELNNEKYLVILHAVDRHVVSNQILHIDLLHISKDAHVNIKVPISLINQNTCPGLKVGGVLNVIMRDVDLKCSAMQIPNALECDLSACNIGDSIRIKDLSLPAGAHLVHSEEDTVLSIIAPQAEETVETTGTEEESDSADKSEE